MRKCRFGWAGLGVLAGVATASVAHADPPGSKATPVYVLTIDSDDADDQADALTVALRSQVKHAAGYSLLETSQSLGTLIVALKCPSKPDATCLDRIGDQIHADHVMWGQMAKKAGRVSVDLHLWSRGKPEVVDSEQYADTLTDPNAPELVTVAGHAFAQLTGLAPETRHPATHPTPAPAPVETAPLEPPPEHHAASGAATRIVAGYTILALGAVGLGVGAVEGARFYGARSTLNTARQSVPASVADVCTSSLASASTACQDYHHAVTIRTGEYVSLGVGAALAITGTIFLLLPNSDTHVDEKPVEKTASWNLLPVVTAHGGAAVLAGTF